MLEPAAAVEPDLLPVFVLAAGAVGLLAISGEVEGVGTFGGAVSTGAMVSGPEEGGDGVVVLVAAMGGN